MPRRPLIGLTASVTSDGELDTTTPRVHLNRAYVTAVQSAGGVPLMLPPGLDGAGLDELWERLDGLILTGGGDVDPARFDEPAHPTTSLISEARDRLELELTHRALDTRRPLFAICRGVQVLNVALGGSLHQHLPDAYPASAIAHSQTAPRPQPTHAVKVMGEGTRLGAILGALELEVNSFHHQAIKRLGRGLREVAWAPDGVIEGLELPDARALAIGVQWHPEDLAGHDPASRALFRALVEAAQAR